MDDEEEGSDLSDVTTEDLMDELFDRFDAVVFCAMQNRSAEQAYVYPEFSGEYVVCAGLCDYLRSAIIGAWRGTQRKPPE